MPSRKPLDPLIRDAVTNMLRIGWQEAHDRFCDFGPGHHPEIHPVNPHGTEPPK